VAATEDAIASNTFAHWRETHNAYTQVSSEEGLPAAFFYVGAMVFCFKELGAIRRICRSAQASPPAGAASQNFANKYDEISTMAFCLSLSLVSFAVFGFFSAMAYQFFFPTLAGLTAAFGRAARAELSTADIKTTKIARSIWERPAAAMRPAVTV